MTLTARQRAVLEYLCVKHKAQVRPPTRREIAAFFGWRSKTSVDNHLAALERKGFIRKVEGGSRNIEVVASQPYCAKRLKVL